VCNVVKHKTIGYNRNYVKKMACFVKDGENGGWRELGQKVHVYNLILIILPHSAYIELDVER